MNANASNPYGHNDNRHGALRKELQTEDPQPESQRSGINRLIHEKSPYLLQHARNPVDWYPWGEEAFAKARKEGKAIFLSIGYSTCHWCHVMEAESFENEGIAEIINREFVAIKVDREERPDVDQVYMAYVQATTGSGGWPMSVWLTPELKPFFGGTYFPPATRWGRPGFESILLQIAKAWKTQRQRLVAAGEGAMEQLRRLTFVEASQRAGLDGVLLDRAYSALKASYDPRYGGFGGPHKFPLPSVSNFMLRFYARSLRSGKPVPEALDMVRFTLREMAEGGIYDQLGGGFHRYAVDERWHVPHFEKMLYDQGQLVCTYLDAYRITRDAFMADVARGILDYVLRDMTGTEGGFFSAEDADSPLPEAVGTRREGAFYVWKRQEIEAVLGKHSAAVFAFRYGVEERGNVRDDPHGEFGDKNVLMVAHSIPETARRFGITEEETERALLDGRRKLLGVRQGRPRPHLDDKAITAWIGLMISGFSRAYQVLGGARYLATAEAAAAFVRKHLYRSEGGLLLRRYRDGDAAVDAYAADYAFLIQGLLDLYEASHREADLTWALQLQGTQDERFWDTGAGGYFSTSGKDETIIFRLKDGDDGAEPSPNSVAVLNLLRLAQMTGHERLRDRAEQTLATFGPQLQRAPCAMPQMMASLDFYLDKPRQVVIAGRRGAPDTLAMLRAIQAPFVPNKVVLIADSEGCRGPWDGRLDHVTNAVMIDGKATAYVCENGHCQLPTTDADRAAELLSTAGLPRPISKGETAEPHSQNEREHPRREVYP